MAEAVEILGQGLSVFVRDIASPDFLVSSQLLLWVITMVQLLLREPALACSYFKLIQKVELVGWRSRLKKI